ncbi:MAG: LysR substrate-binding domain-containing protein [Steroidobacteraceae bacterium]
MELRNLRAFVEVVRQGGFSQAAKAVFATQSTVSKAVKHLEDELGLVLLERSVHGPTLTAAGEIVLRRAQRILAERQDLLTELSDLRGLKRGVLRLGLPPVGSALLFAPVFAAFHGLYPGIQIQLSEHGAGRLEELLRAGEVELAGLLAPVSPDFQAQQVRSEPIVALLPPNHPLAVRDTVAMLELAPVPFLMPEAGFALHPMILRACERAGFKPNVVASSGQQDFLAGMVAAGLGVAFTPRMIAQNLASRSRLRIVEIRNSQMQWNLVLAWRRNAYLSHAANAWLALMRESLDAGPTAKGQSRDTRRAQMTPKKTP